MVQQVIDMHQHLDDMRDAAPLAEAYAACGVRKAVLLGHPPNQVPGNNEIVLEASRRFAELYVPFMGFDLDGMRAEDVDRARDAGFAGLKLIGPRRRYNHRRYSPVYKRAAELGMPILFHLGIVANFGPWSHCDSSLMRPVYLDHIARTHPGLKVIGAHFGNPWCTEAAMCCRANTNLFFDLSGSLLQSVTSEFIGRLLWWTPATSSSSPDRAYAWERIVFGSDVPHLYLREAMDGYARLLEELKVSRELRDAVWHDTGARLLGLSE